MNHPPARELLAQALHTLRPVLDIVEQRVTREEPPPWCEQRGWSDFLLSLPDESLANAEAHGLAVVMRGLPHAPRDLRELAEDVERATALPHIASRAAELEPALLSSVSARKREQITLLLGALGPMATPATRIVDVGAGRGAFTRIAARHFARATLGIERASDRVRSASALAARNGVEFAANASPQFEERDACGEGLELAPGDLAVGLHACGELGDTLVQTVSAVGCDAALISCCLQKISTPKRTALSRTGAELSLSRAVLGLTNQTAHVQGIETSLEQTQRARTTRYALYLLLRSRGAALEPGEAMRGINRRRAQHGLADIAARALRSRGLAAASAAELAHHEQLAEQSYGLIRRLALPRSMLARLVEVSVTLDRATHLEEHGLCTRVATLFDGPVSPRNLALFASREAARLP